MEEVALDVRRCRLCSLGSGRKNAVPGSGDYRARLVIVGEGPGAWEDELGEPFVGRSGKLLDKVIESHGGLMRSDIFITNVVKCRPPNNRTPLPQEMAACRVHLKKQLDTIRPKVILCMGSTAAQALTGQALPLSRIRGRNLSGLKPAIFATYHPSYGLRMGDQVIRYMESDFALAANLALGI